MSDFQQEQDEIGFRNFLQEKTKEQLIDVVIEWKQRAKENYSSFTELKKKYSQLATAYCYFTDIEVI